MDHLRFSIRSESKYWHALRGLHILKSYKDNSESFIIKTIHYYNIRKEFLMDKEEQGIIATLFEKLEAQLPSNTLNTKVVYDENGYVTDLTVKHAMLHELPAEIRYLTRLESLNLSFNQFEQIPVEVLDLPSLRILSMYNNNITMVPPEINQMIFLENLDLNHNHLTHFPDALCFLPHLRYLALDANGIRKQGIDVIPESIERLQQLRFFSMTAHALKTLPSEIGELHSLEWLNLTSNSGQLLTLPDTFGLLTNLKYLHMSGHRLKELPETFWQLNQLTSLLLNKNRFQSLPKEIGHLNKLQLLSLRENQLTELPEEIGLLEQLEDLNLAGNKLSHLPPEIGLLENLSELDVSDNDLEDLPAEICDLPNLFILVVENNHHLMNPPLSIARKGIKEVKSYFEEQAQKRLMDSRLEPPKITKRGKHSRKRERG